MGKRVSLLTARPSSRGFTLVELVIVIVLFAAIFALVPLSFGSFSYWRQESFIRKLTDTIQFLFHQSVADQVFYRIEFDLVRGTYRVGALEPHTGLVVDLPTYDQGAGDLTLQLASFLNPSPGSISEMVSPAAFPSLAEPVALPDGATIEAVRNMSGQRTRERGETATLTFSPRGFSEFGVIHLKLIGGGVVTILVNPFTGIAEVHRAFKDFEWTFGRNQGQATGDIS